tara:strand:+ start:705 stop:941 length:237 start_codon:yes stop_codon:yes gene_type:complete
MYCSIQDIVKNYNAMRGKNRGWTYREAARKYKVRMAIEKRKKKGQAQKIPPDNNKKRIKDNKYINITKLSFLSCSSQT